MKITHFISIIGIVLFIKENERTLASSKIFLLIEYLQKQNKINIKLFVDNRFTRLSMLKPRPIDEKSLANLQSIRFQIRF